MDIPSHVSVDQLEVLVDIVEHGSFTAAARARRRTQGAVSYHVARLEEQLGVELFDRSGHRPALTEAGRVVVGRAREVLRGLVSLKAAAGALRSGVEASLALTVDVLYPPAKIAVMLSRFEAAFPHVQLTLRGGVFHEPIEDLREGRADLAIGPPQLVDEGFAARHCLEVEFVAVAAPGHPLAQREGRIPADDFHAHRRLVLTTSRPLPADATEAHRSVWRLADSALRRGLVLEGVGWSRLPRFEVAEDLAAGRLVELRVDGWLGITGTSLAVVHRSDQALGPAARWLVDFLAGGPA